MPPRVEDSSDDSDGEGDKPSGKNVPPPKRQRQGKAPKEKEMAMESEDTEHEEGKTVPPIPFGTKVLRDTNDKTQPVRQLEWTFVTPKAVEDDARFKVTGKEGTNYAPEFKNVACTNKMDNISDVYMHMMVRRTLLKKIKVINETLKPDNEDPNYHPTSEGEMLRWRGIALAMAANGGQTPREYFKTSESEFDLFSPPALGRHGMSKNRFFVLYRVQRLVRGTSKPEGCNDAWWFCREYFDDFAEHRRLTYCPGAIGEVDEKMCAWLGGEGVGSVDKIPHRSYVPRKPEDLGLETTCSADAQSGVMMLYEPEEGAQSHKALEHFAEYGHNTALTVRMAKPFANQNRVFIGDSRFGSVKSLVACWRHHKVHSIYAVKTATALFPSDALKTHCGLAHGSLVVMTATVPIDGKDLKIFAVAQRRGPKVHTFLASCGTTVLEVPKRFLNIPSVQEAPYLTPNVLNYYTYGQPVIDLHNRDQQFELAMEKQFVTNSFASRMDTHAMGWEFIDTHRAARFHLVNYHNMDFKQAMAELSYRLVYNPLLAAELAGKNPHKTPSMNRRELGMVRIGDGPPSRESPGKHVLIPLRQLAGYKGPKQQRCTMCDKLVSWVCARCTVDPSHLVPLHPPNVLGGKHHECLAMHRRDPTTSYKLIHQSATGISAASRRRRRVPVAIVF